MNNPYTSVENSKPLSASKIKTFESCSWLYYAKYVLKLPDSSNLGAQQGTVCHTIFECLLNPRHKKIYDSIVAQPASIKNSAAVERLVRSYIKKNKMPEECFDKIDAMTVVGLLHDFFFDRSEAKPSKIESELEFNIRNEDPLYVIRGFIDQFALYEAEGFARIRDFKSSKKRFEGTELTENVQAMMYSLAARHLHPHLKPVVDFLFLQFPENPVQRLKFNNEQLNDFEHFLAEVYQKTNNFTEEDAKSNFAADQKVGKNDGFKGPLVCGFCKTPGEKKLDGSPKGYCKFKFPFEYKALCSEDGEVIKTSFEDDLKADESKGQFVISKKYKGCARWNSSNYSKNSGDLF
jgi:ATP-dependent helicase/DNAse subunit B